MGYSVAYLGDLNGDTIADILVGNNASDDGGTNKGSAWVLFLNNDGTVKAHQKISSTQGNFSGILDNGDYFGSSVTNIGDLDGDLITDVAVGAFYDDDGGTNSQFLPWLDVDQDTGLVGVVWYDARNDPSNQQVEVFQGFSNDGGSTFLPNILVSDGQSDQSVANANRTVNNYLEYIGIALHDCESFAVWADNSTNLADLDYFTDQVEIEEEVCEVDDDDDDDDDDD